MSATLSALKSHSTAKEVEEKGKNDHHRAALIMAREYLRAHGYVNAAEALRKEDKSQIFEKFELADNVDLAAVIKEFEAYYTMKIGRPPKLLRPRASENDPPPPERRRPSRNVASAPATAVAVPKEAGESVALNVMKARLGIGGAAPQNAAGGAPEAGDAKPVWLDGVSGSKLEVRSRRDERANHAEDERVQRPPPTFGGDIELQALAAGITREIYRAHNITWESVVGLVTAKRLLKEAVVMPVRYPQLFKGVTASWGGILLYGPPGTGKTMLARAVAAECGTTFFNISASSIVSKYRGDSEKLVRVLFELGRHHAPSTIFIDEIDSIMAQRGGAGGEHEGSRRMKTELLIQMDGLAAHDERQVTVLAASNLPWELDIALVRRLEKRVHVPLPDAEARAAMLESFLPSDRRAADLDVTTAVASTEGYSGADLMLLAKEAAMRPVRRILTQLEAMNADRVGAPAAIDDGDVEELLRENKITVEDFDGARKSTNASAKLYAERYTTWEREFGSTIS